MMLELHAKGFWGKQLEKKEVLDLVKEFDANSDGKSKIFNIKKILKEWNNLNFLQKDLWIFTNMKVCSKLYTENKEMKAFTLLKNLAKQKTINLFLNKKLMKWWQNYLLFYSESIINKSLAKLIIYLMNTLKKADSLKKTSKISPLM